MKQLSGAISALILSAVSLLAYERLQGPTEVLYWNKTAAFAGYTFFGVRSNTYLINMEGRVVHTWPGGTNPHLLDNGGVLDATGGDINGFPGFKEVDWNGNTVWQYTETRTNYAPHHDFLRIYNAQLGTNTTLYIAAKSITSNACVAAGCNPANGPYTNAQADAIVEVDMAGNIIWEWCFFDHGIQDFDAGKSNYVGAGKNISNYVGRLNLNLPGRPVTNDWLHCNSIDYNTNLDQIVINAAGGEFYVIDHGKTFVAGNPAASIALAASTNGDFLYRFGDPARYSQGSAPFISPNWTVSSTGNKQIGPSSHAQWIPAGLPGAGHFLVFNNGSDLFETTPQSYIFEINGYLNAATNDTGAYVNPPAAGYNIWSAPGNDTDKQKKNMSRQITWMYFSMANQGMFSHLDSSVQRLPNGNTLICDSTEGHIFEVTPAGEAVWEYINPVSVDGIISYKRDNWPMYNFLFRACRYAANHPALVGRTLVPQSTITGVSPSFLSAPSISSTAINPPSPTAASSVWTTSLITNNGAIASVALNYIVSGITNTVAMLDDGLHLDGAAGDGVFGGQIPILPAGANVSYYITAQNDFGLATADPATAPGSSYSYLVKTSAVTTAVVFLETMATNSVKPWTGAGCDNLWTVTYTGSNPFEQGRSANYGSGNTNSLTFKGGTANFSDSMITTAQGINAQGSSGTLQFYIFADGMSGNAGWTMQLNSGGGFTTRTNESSGTNHGWQSYSYYLQPSELVSNLFLRFQFRGGAITNRIFLDQISLTVNTNPLPVLGGLVSNNGRVQLSIAGATGLFYTVQASTNLINWTDLCTTNLSTSPCLWFDPKQTNFSSRFYRVRTSQ